MTDQEKPVVIRYEREGDLIRLTFTNVTNHELREVLVGLWARLEPPDRIDHIQGLLHYANADDAWLSPVAAAIARGEKSGRAIDLSALAKRGERVRP